MNPALWWDATARFLQTVHFGWIVAAWFALATPVFLWLWRRKQKAVAATAITGKHKTNRFAFRVVLCGSLLAVSWAALTVALMDPKYDTVEQKRSYKAAEVVFMFDVSGSMYGTDVRSKELAALVDTWQKEQYDRLVAKKRRFPLLYPNEIPPPFKRPDGTPPDAVRRIDAGEYIMWHVLDQRRPGSTNRYALAYFADSVAWVEILAKDPEVVMESLMLMRPDGVGGGTNFDGPEGAVPACIEQFKNEGQANVRVMVFVSDGDAGISDEAQAEFVKQFTEPQPWHKDKKVKHYVCYLHCGPKDRIPPSIPRLCKAVNPKTPLFEKPARWVGNAQEVQEAIAWLNDLTTSPIEEDPITQEHSLRHLFLIIAFSSLIGFVVSCTAFRETY